jgi:hypothetical protein
MTRADDKYGKNILEPLKPVPPVDAQIFEQEKAKFLLHGETLRKDLLSQATMELTVQIQKNPKAMRTRKPLPLMKALVGTLLALLILIASSATVYATQNSLPGESLYALKAISEDIRLSLTRSPETKLEMTLKYTNRRLDEITTLISEGKALSQQASERYESELDSALWLAAGMGDEQMQAALGQIKHYAEKQGIIMEELVKDLPEQANPAIIKLQQRIQEQVRVSTIGETDPGTFRNKIHERQREESGPNRHNNPEGSDVNPPMPTRTHSSTEETTKPGNRRGQPSQVPGSGESDQPTQAPDSNRSDQPIQTPEPGGVIHPTKTPESAGMNQPTHTPDSGGSNPGHGNPNP